jgi:leader peptidase (prepilin peptidase) / N-methyltransferase
VARPRRSRCPSCRRELTWRENLPLVSWLVQRGRCRGCGWRIPLRYPLVEALTAVLWFTAAWCLRAEWRFAPGEPVPWGAFALLAIHVLVLSALVVASFVDFAIFEIPDEISIGGIVLAPLCSLAVPRLHEHTWLAQSLSEGPGVDRIGALLGSLAGIAVGGGVLLAIGWAGRRIWGREAMGLGDVKLLAAAGGFLGPGGALLALVVGTFAASGAGLVNVLRFTWLSWRRARRRGGEARLLRALRTGRVAGRYLPFGPYLGIGIGIALLAWNDVVVLWR